MERMPSDLIDLISAAAASQISDGGLMRSAFLREGTARAFSQAHLIGVKERVMHGHGSYSKKT